MTSYCFALTLSSEIIGNFKAILPKICTRSFIVKPEFILVLFSKDNAFFAVKFFDIMFILVIMINQDYICFSKFCQYIFQCKQPVFRVALYAFSCIWKTFQIGIEITYQRRVISSTLKFKNYNSTLEKKTLTQNQSQFSAVANC